MCKRAGLNVNILKLITIYFQKLELRNFNEIPEMLYTNWPLSLRKLFLIAFPQHSFKHSSRTPRITMQLLPSRCLQMQKWPCQRTEDRSSRVPPRGGGWGQGSPKREKIKQSKSNVNRALRFESQRQTGHTFLNPRFSEGRKSDT